MGNSIGFQDTDDPNRIDAAAVQQQQPVPALPATPLRGLAPLLPRLRAAGPTSMRLMYRRGAPRFVAFDVLAVNSRDVPAEAIRRLAPLRS
jgi:hypothetical protein